MINGNSGWRSPRAVALLQLSFFSGKTYKTKKMTKEEGK